MVLPDTHAPSGLSCGWSAHLPNLSVRVSLLCHSFSVDSFLSWPRPSAGAELPPHVAQKSQPHGSRVLPAPNAGTHVSGLSATLGHGPPSLRDHLCRPHSGQQSLVAASPFPSLHPELFQPLPVSQPQGRLHVSRRLAPQYPCSPVPGPTWVSSGCRLTDRSRGPVTGLEAGTSEIGAPAWSGSDAAGREREGEALCLGSLLEEP